MSFQQITIIGNVGKDPVIKKLSSGATVASFAVACSEKYTSKGEAQEKTTWYNLDVWQQTDKGIITSLVQPYITKGQALFIQGTPVIEEYEKDGVKMRSFKIKLGGPGSTIRMMGGSKKEKTETSSTPADHGTPPGEDDIPF